MMWAVPAVDLQQYVHRDIPDLGISDRTGKILWPQSFQEGNPATVKRVEHGQRAFDRIFARVTEFRPRSLVVGADGRILLRHGKLEADIGVHM